MRASRPAPVAFLLLAAFLAATVVSLQPHESPADVQLVVEYLSKYGYLPASEGSSGGSLLSERALREAVAAMQRFGRLPPTGRVDADTVRLVRRRRCGVPDLLPPGLQPRARRYAIQGQKWTTTDLTWSVQGRPTADMAMVRSQLRRAFSVWSGAASALSFREVGAAAGPADVQVSFLKGRHGDGYPFDGEGAVLAHAFFPGEGIGGDAHFDAEERWLPSQPLHEDDGVNLFAVAAHEIGHSLGLSHSSTPGSLMFPYYQVMGEHFTLPKDDADGIRHLYGFKDSDVQPTMPTIPSAQPTTISTTITTTTTTDDDDDEDAAATTTTQLSTSTTKRSKTVTKKTTMKPRKTTLRPVTTDLPEIPDVCNTSIDAISIIRRELFVFKGKYFWRMNLNRTVKAGYPASIERFWYDLPRNIEKVDAVYERPHDTKIVFFIGRQFWVFSGNQPEADYPRPLTALGLPPELERVNAALVWGHNGRTYLFGGGEYWKLDEAEGRVELDYPRSMAAWRGLPHHIDAAMLWTDGNTYFFKGHQYWKFIDIKMKIENKAAKNIGDFWFKCLNQTSERAETTSFSPTLEKVYNQADMLKQPQAYLIIILLFYLSCIYN